jgi:ABC-type antimicrobial peptide transport system permease subunit
MAYAVAQRTGEFGIRLALGALPRDILGMVLRQGMKLALVGVGMGLGVALALGRLLSGMLYEVSPADPLTLAGVALALGVALLVACWVPARRATRVAPTEALRAG